jgi:hypothetical protein
MRMIWYGLKYAANGIRNLFNQDSGWLRELAKRNDGIVVHGDESSRTPGAPLKLPLLGWGSLFASVKIISQHSPNQLKAVILSDRRERRIPLQWIHGNKPYSS